MVDRRGMELSGVNSSASNIVQVSVQKKASKQLEAVMSIVLSGVVAPPVAGKGQKVDVVA